MKWAASRVLAFVTQSVRLTPRLATWLMRFAVRSGVDFVRGAYYFTLFLAMAMVGAIFRFIAFTLSIPVMIWRAARLGTRPTYNNSIEAASLDHPEEMIGADWTYGRRRHRYYADVVRNVGERDRPGFGRSRASDSQAAVRTAGALHGAAGLHCDFSCRRERILRKRYKWNRWSTRTKRQ